MIMLAGFSLAEQSRHSKVAEAAQERQFGGISAEGSEVGARERERNKKREREE